MPGQPSQEQDFGVHADESAISVRNVSKSYKIYQKNSDLLREIVSGRPCHSEFWALRDVSFSVPRGAVVGIIGPNGSGKSTLLRIVAGRLNATRGSVALNGNAAILELGVGFHPDFTGRQNIITGGMYLGLSRDQIEEKLAWIIDFSELHSVIDQPFRTYSTGMQARLTFTTAVANVPEILIIDEALAAGDAYFVAKSFGRIREICASGTTVLFVSHGTNQVASLCSQAIWLEDGEVKEIGPAREVARSYDYNTHVRISGNKGKVVEIELPQPFQDKGEDTPALPQNDLNGELADESPTPPNISAEDDLTIAAAEMLLTSPAAEEIPELLCDPLATSGQDENNLHFSETPEEIAVQQFDLVGAEAITLQPDDAAPPTVISKSRVYKRGPIAIDRVVITNGGKHTPDVFRTWEPMRIAVHYSCEGPPPEETLGLAIGIQREADNQLVAQFNTNNPAGNESIAYDDAPFRLRPKQSGIISAYFESLQILAGDYLVSVGLTPNIPSLVDFYEYHHHIYRIRVESGAHKSGALFYPVVNWIHRAETGEE